MNHDLPRRATGWTLSMLCDLKFLRYRARFDARCGKCDKDLVVFFQISMAEMGPARWTDKKAQRTFLRAMNEGLRNGGPRRGCEGRKWTSEERAAFERALEGFQDAELLLRKIKP